MHLSTTKTKLTCDGGIHVGFSSSTEANQSASPLWTLGVAGKGTPPAHDLVDNYNQVKKKESEHEKL